MAPYLDGIPMQSPKYKLKATYTVEFLTVTSRVDTYGKDRFTTKHIVAPETSFKFAKTSIYIFFIYYIN